MLNKRALPWRSTKDPYKIWISEIILQQTRVSQGLNYYNSFIKSYPNIKLLARAKEQDVLNKWRGLGYYSRARNLHYTSKFIANEYGGVFPTEYEQIIKLKGIGRYTAAAVASFSFNQPYAVLDGNVYRVLSRLFDISISINTTDGQKYFSELAQKLMDYNNPAKYNQAIMEFGALHCTYRKPSCEDCVFEEICLSNLRGTVLERPQKIKKIKTRKRFFVYFLEISRDKQKIVIQKRSDKDIWASLYEVPQVEFLSEDLFNKEIDRHLLKDRKVSSVIKHVLSHQKIFAVFVHIEKCFEGDVEGQFQVNYNELTKYPMPRLIDAYLENYF